MEVVINWKGKEEVVVVKKLKHKDVKKILSEAIKNVKWLGNEVPNIEVDVIKYQTSVVKNSIEKAPFEITDENIDELDAEDFNKILEAVHKENPFLYGE